MVAGFLYLYFSNNGSWYKVYLQVCYGAILRGIVHLFNRLFDKDVLCVQTIKWSKGLIKTVFLWEFFGSILCVVSRGFLFLKCASWEILKSLITVIDSIGMKRVISLSVFNVVVISLKKQNFLLGFLAECSKRIRICDILAALILLGFNIFAYWFLLIAVACYCFSSAFLFCKSKTLVGLFYKLDALMVDFNGLWILAFSLAVFKVIAVHDWLNVWVSL